jgi:hypothetical protein
MSLPDLPIPAAMISAEDGVWVRLRRLISFDADDTFFLQLVNSYWREDGVLLSFPKAAPAVKYPNPNSGLMSSFSTYGPTFDMYLKPAISAPGSVRSEVCIYRSDISPQWQHHLHFPYLHGQIRRPLGNLHGHARCRRSSSAHSRIPRQDQNNRPRHARSPSNECFTGEDQQVRRWAVFLCCTSRWRAHQRLQCGTRGNSRHTWSIPLERHELFQENVRRHGSFVSIT